MILNFMITHFKSLFNDKSIPFDVLFFSILLITIPIVLISGPALPDIFLSLIALYFLIKSILKKNGNIIKIQFFMDLYYLAYMEL